MAIIVNNPDKCNFFKVYISVFMRSIVFFASESNALVLQYYYYLIWYLDS